MNPYKRVLEGGAVALDDWKIVAVSGTEELEAEYDVDQVIDASGKAVLPGFVNVHTHLPSISIGGIRSSSGRLVSSTFPGKRVPQARALLHSGAGIMC